MESDCEGGIAMFFFQFFSVRFVFISGCFLSKIEDVNYYILVTVVVIDSREIDTETCLVIIRSHIIFL